MTKPVGSTGPQPDAPSFPSLFAPPTGAEHGLRGVISAILVLEAIALLLALTVVHNGGASAPGWHLGVIAGLAGLHAGLPAVLRRAWGMWAIGAAQLLVIACWYLHPAIGITGIVFCVAWILLILLRREFRRRILAHTAPTHDPHP